MSAEQTPGSEVDFVGSGGGGASDVLGQRMGRRSFLTRAALVGATAASAPMLLGVRGPQAGRGPGGGPPPGQEGSVINPLVRRRHAIVRSDVAIPGEGGPIRAYEARPANVGRAPGVLVIHENQGLVPYLRDVVNGLATSGYAAVVPDLLSREGGTVVVPDVPDALDGIPRSRHITDLQSTLDYLRGQDGVGRIGVVGFCFGGTLTWAFATEADGLSAAVPFYGAADEDLQAAAGNIEAAIFAVYAEDDDRVNATREAMLAALEADGVIHQSETYPGTVHAFHNHTREDRYDERQAAAAWEDTLRWLNRHLTRQPAHSAAPEAVGGR